MKIYVVNGDSGVAPDGTKGAAAHLRGVVTGFRARGHEILMFSARLPAVPDGSVGPVLPLAALGAAAAASPPDLIYERYSLGHLGGLHTAAAQARPFVLEVNAPLLLEAEQHRSYIPRLSDVTAELELLRRASLVVAVSNPLRDYVVEKRRHSRGVVVVPNGCDLAMFPRRASLVQHGRASLVFLGNPKPWHGAGQLVPLVAHLTAAGLDPELTVIGGGPGAGRLLGDAAAAGVAGRIQATGSLPQSAAAARLREGLVGLAPYERQDFFYFSPLKIVEYMAAGLPVVTTDQGDLESMVGSGGLVVPAGARDRLTEAVAGLITSPELRLQLGRRGRRRAFARSSWEAVTGRIESALLGMLQAVGA